MTCVDKKGNNHHNLWMEIDFTCWWRGQYRHQLSDLELSSGSRRGECKGGNFHTLGLRVRADASVPSIQVSRRPLFIFTRGHRQW